MYMCTKNMHKEFSRQKTKSIYLMTSFWLICSGRFYHEGQVKLLATFSVNTTDSSGVTRISRVEFCVSWQICLLFYLSRFCLCSKVILALTATLTGSPCGRHEIKSGDTVLIPFTAQEHKTLGSISLLWLSHTQAGFTLPWACQHFTL